MEKKNIITHLICGGFLILFSIIFVPISYFIIRDNNLDKTGKICLIFMNVGLIIGGLFFLILGLSHIKELKKD